MQTVTDCDAVHSTFGLTMWKPKTSLPLYLYQSVSPLATLPVTFCASEPSSMSASLNADACDWFLP